MLDTIRPFLSRIIAAGVASLAGLVAGKLGFEISTEDQAALASSLATFVTLVIYALAHRLIDKKANPGDAAAVSIARQEKAQAESAEIPYSSGRQRGDI